MHVQSDLYRQVSDHSRVEGSTPHGLILMLFDACISHIELAKIAITNGPVSQKQKHISRSGDIVRYLRQCINMHNQEAIQMGQHLSDLYSFVENQLLQANSKNQIIFLNNAQSVMENIRAGWSDMKNV